MLGEQNNAACRRPIATPPDTAPMELALRTMYPSHWIVKEMVALLEEQEPKSTRPARSAFQTEPLPMAL